MQEQHWYARASQLSPDQLRLLGTTVIVAPHQDDESLGCGGTIRLLTQLKVPVYVLFVSDGSMSHPNSKKYPKDKLVSLREDESKKALKILGVREECITFLRLPDSQVPSAGTPDFDSAVSAVMEVLDQVEAKTVFVPWQRDPHPDHRATWQIVDRALTFFKYPIRKLEYFIWLWERAGFHDLPEEGECKVWQTDIQTVITYKIQAVESHVSQVTPLIDDDPQGFTLSKEVLAHFSKPYEIFVEI